MASTEICPRLEEMLIDCDRIKSVCGAGSVASVSVTCRALFCNATTIPVAISSNTPAEIMRLFSKAKLFNRAEVVAVEVSIWQVIDPGDNETAASNLCMRGPNEYLLRVNKLPV